MKKTLVRLKVRREVVHTLTVRGLATVAAGAGKESKLDGGCISNQDCLMDPNAS